MSGGSYNYAYSRIEQFMEDMAHCEAKPLRMAFYKHLDLVSKAMKEIEWEDSGDGGHEDEAIRACLTDKTAPMREHVDRLERVLRDALEELDRQ